MLCVEKKENRNTNTGEKTHFRVHSGSLGVTRSHSESARPTFEYARCAFPRRMRALCIHVGVLVTVAFAGSALISLYGETCGIHFTRPNTWFRVFISAGSPWCKSLNHITSVCSYFLDNMWMHAVGLLITFITTWTTVEEKKSIAPVPVAEIARSVRI